MRKTIISICVVLVICLNTLSVSAAERGCSNGAHSSLTLVSMRLEYREKTGEHIVVDPNGYSSVCYIYKDYYAAQYYCHACNEYVYMSVIDDEIHGHSGCPQYGS